MLRHFLDDFMSFVPLQMPQLLNVATMEEPQFYGDYVLLTFPLRDPYDLEEVMDIFEDEVCSWRYSSPLCKSLFIK